MAPPDRPRFVLRSVTGYSIGLDGRNGSERRAYTSWTVADSWHNYKQVYESSPGAAGERSARRICAWLEADDCDEIAEGHGTANSYTNHRCRCDHCTAAATFGKYEQLWRKRREALAS